MHKLANFSLANRALIALVTIVAAIFGGLALTNLKQELIPSIQIPQFVIVTSYPGASPEVVSNSVSSPIEKAIQTVPGLESTTSTSSTGVSMVVVAFDYGTNLQTAEQKVLSAIARIKATLPENSDPLVIAAGLDDLPIISVSASTTGDLEELVQALNGIAIPELEKLDEIRQVSLAGAAVSEVQIIPNDAALAQLGLDRSMLTNVLRANGNLLPGGSLLDGNFTLPVQVGERLTSAEDIAALPIPGTNFTFGDFAEVNLTTADVTSISRVNGQSAVTLSFNKTIDSNTVAASTAVKEKLDELSTTLGVPVSFHVVFDQAPYIQQSIETLAVEGMLGLAFAVLVILIFLLSVRLTIVTAISIPTSVLLTFIGLQGFDYSLNMLTLGAITISIGRVVDDSIVVIENIKHHLADGVDKITAIKTAVKEVATAITSATITTVAVFLPISFVGDMTGELFRPFALTVTLSLLASLFVSLTIVPVLAYWIAKPATKRGHRRAAESATESIGLLQASYRPILRGTLRFPLVTLLVSILILGGTFSLIPLLKTNFIGDSGQNTLNVSQQLEPGLSLSAMDGSTKAVEATLASFAEIETYQMTIGSSGLSAVMGALSGGARSSVSYSITTREGADQTKLQNEIRDALNALQGVGTFSLSSGSGFGSSSSVSVIVSAGDPANLDAAAKYVFNEAKKLESAAEVSTTMSKQQPQASVTINRIEAAKYGLTETQIGMAISSIMNPQLVGTIQIDNNQLNIYMRSNSAIETLEELPDFQIATPVGMIPLSEIATIESTLQPASITAHNSVRTVTVSITPKTADLSATTFEVTEMLSNIDLPAGVNAEMGGLAADQEEAFSAMYIALLVAILIVYIVMVATFKSLLQPILLLISVPFAATGAIGLQLITDIPLGVSSLIGLLMLVGIVVTNAIVLIDLVNQFRNRGESVHDSVMHGSLRRLRPILMTALATIFALVPMAMGITGHAGFISQPLAIIVIGGLVSSTLLTLIVLPSLYWLVYGHKERKAEKQLRRSASV
ncbi:MAG: efflux RND transporter permease subunit [Microbacteriaceae bacterium]|nr:efflux RND transporter permease subunit [Microbacteriaceae bacterium]